MSTYRIADVFVEMNCQGRTKKQAHPYLYHTKAVDPQILIPPLEAEISTMKQTQEQLSDDDWEYMLSGSSFYHQLLSYQGFMLHASAVVYKDKAYLFSAPCGTGKSTHTSLWLKTFPGAVILNDDKPAIRLVDGSFFVYGTPWSGKYDLSLNQRVPLQGICFLDQDTNNHIETMSKKESIYAILSQTTRKLEQEDMLLLFQLLDQLIVQIPIYHMGCTMEQEAAQLSYQTMSQLEKKRL